MQFTNAVFVDGNGRHTSFQNFHVLGKNIRYVHLPDNMNVKAAIKTEVDDITSGGRKKVEANPDKQKMTHKREMQALKRLQK